MTKPFMNILLLNQAFHPDPVATAQHTFDLCLHLVKQGCEVTVLTSRRSYDDHLRCYPKREEFREIKIVRVASTGLGRSTLLRRIVDAVTFDIMLLWELIRLPTPDYVISFTSPPLIGVLGALFARWRRCHSVQWLMDINPDAAIAVGYLKRGSWVDRTLTWVMRWSLHNAFAVVVLDRWMKEKVLTHRVREERIFVFAPWAVQVEQPLPLKDEKGLKFRERHGLLNKFIVLYSGNHSIVHPLHTLLEAALRLRDFDEVCFLFIGGGYRVREVAQYKERYGLSNILQLPYQPREILDESLSAANLHVIIMGDSVSGLVHTSKIYGILASGGPFIFIGPRNAHVRDDLAEGAKGYSAEHGEISRVVEIIDTARKLTPDELITIHKTNTQYLKRHFTMENILNSFCLAVLRLNSGWYETAFEAKN